MISRGSADHEMTVALQRFSCNIKPVLEAQLLLIPPSQICSKERVPFLRPQSSPFTQTCSYIPWFLSRFVCWNFEFFPSSTVLLISHSILPTCLGTGCQRWPPSRRLEHELALDSLSMQPRRYHTEMHAKFKKDQKFQSPVGTIPPSETPDRS